MIKEIFLGDVVKVDDGPRTWRVTDRNPKTGMLELEALDAMNRITWSGVHEFRVQTKGRF